MVVKKVVFGFWLMNADDDLGFFPGVVVRCVEVKVEEEDLDLAAVEAIIVVVGSGSCKNMDFRVSTQGKFLESLTMMEWQAYNKHLVPVLVDVLQ